MLPSRLSGPRNCLGGPEETTNVTRVEVMRNTEDKQTRRPAITCHAQNRELLAIAVLYLEIPQPITVARTRESRGWDTPQNCTFGSGNKRDDWAGVSLLAKYQNICKWNTRIRRFLGRLASGRLVLGLDRVVWFGRRWDSSRNPAVLSPVDHSTPLAVQCSAKCSQDVIKLIQDPSEPHRTAPQPLPELVMSSRFIYP